MPRAVRLRDRVGAHGAAPRNTMRLYDITTRHHTLAYEGIHSILADLPAVRHTEQQKHKENKQICGAQWAPQIPLKTCGKSTISMKNVPPAGPTPGPIRASTRGRCSLTCTPGSGTRGSACTQWSITGNAIFRTYKLWLGYFLSSLACRQLPAQ